MVFFKNQQCLIYIFCPPGGAVSAASGGNTSGLADIDPLKSGVLNVGGWYIPNNTGHSLSTSVV